MFWLTCVKSSFHYCISFFLITEQFVLNFILRIIKKEFSAAFTITFSFFVTEIRQIFNRDKIK